MRNNNHLDFVIGAGVHDYISEQSEGHSIHVRSRSMCRGAIYLAEKIIRYSNFQNKGKYSYVNTPYR